MKIAVTAASGQLGSVVLKQLIKDFSKNEIVAIVRTPEKVKSLGAEVRQGDYNNPEQFKEALRDVDKLLIVSGMDAPEKRIQQHRNIINASKETGVRKIVYTSVIGSSEGSSFSPIVASNRQTEEDVKNSGLDWSIGRNGLYIEPDVEYIDNYKKAGKLSNCAGDGKCSYTTRDELAYAYSKMLTEEKHNGKTYYLTGQSITQQQLADYMNIAFNTNLKYEPMSVEDYKKDRITELGEFMGTVIAGIYQGIRHGDFDCPSDYKLAAARKHISWQDYFWGLNKE